MTTTAKPETRLEPPAAEDRGGLGNFGLVHLVACLGAGAAVVLAINLIEWLR